MKQCDMTAMLDRHGIPYALLPIGGGRSILVMQRGGRIYGPFSGEDGESLFWVPDFWKSDAAFEEFLNSGNWNVGGDRIWIAPELQFSVGDRYRFWETLHTPEAIDPGDYTLSTCGGIVNLDQTIDLEAHVLAEGRIHLELERQIYAAANPLASVDAELMENVEFCGFTHSLRLKAAGDQGIYAACWDLLQVKPKGKVYIPMYTPHHGVNYYEPIGELEQLSNAGVIDTATGHDRYKVGYKSAYVCGRFGYAGSIDGRAYLLIRNYPNDPSNPYGEEPPAMPGENGFSFHIYNDDGASGGFTELECNLTSVCAASESSESLDRISTWIFFGDREQLARIGKRLLGFDGIAFE